MLLKILASFAVALAAVWTVVSPTSAPTLDPGRAPTQDELWPGSDGWADAVLDTLTLEEKVGQLFVAGTSAPVEGRAGQAWDALVARVARGEVGGVVFSTGDAAEQAEAIRELQSRAPIPLLISQDIETGVGMRLSGATSFPSAMALGAARSVELAYLQGRATAAEARAIGVHVGYAPVADVNVNPDNPVINVRSYGADAASVGALVTATLRGLQDGGVIATAKHFPGHGDTSADTHTRLATIGADRARLDAVELAPFREAVEAGVMSVMTGHLAVPAFEDPAPGGAPRPATLSPPIVTGVLRDELGFDGLVVTDGLGMAAVRAEGSAGEVAVLALEAGADQLLLSTDADGAARDVAAAVRAGRLTEGRIDASARRVLRAKAWAGLDDPERRTARVSALDAPSDALRSRSASLGRHIARRAVTVVPRVRGAVPWVGPGAPSRVLTVVLDDGFDLSTGLPLTEAIASYIPDQGAALSRRLGLGDPDEAYALALESLPDVDVVLLAAFRRARSGQDELALPARHAAFARQAIASGTPVVLAAFGTPYVGSSLTGADAFVTAYGDGPAEQRAVADALFGRSAITGHLPVPIPGIGGLGDGLQARQQLPRPGTALDAGLAADTDDRIDAAVRDGLSERAYPGAAVAIGRGGVLVRLKGYGSLTYGGKSATADTPYDLASLTKVVGTTAVLMQLVEQGLVDLDAPVNDYVPAFRPSQGGERVTVRHLLSHTAGQRPWYPFYAEGLLDRRSALDFIHRDTLRSRPGSRTRYSDFDMIVLGEVIEAVTDRSLDLAFDDLVFGPLGMEHTGFRGVDVVDPFAAPTEQDRTWRRRTLQGEVHDEAASVLGGVAGHAGLFSTASDLSTFGFALANRGQANGARLFSARTIDRFSERDRRGSRFGLGWMVPSTDGGYSSSGSHFGPRSFGHTGFTGTSIWVDPDQEMFVVLLTNRVHPTRRGSKIGPVRAAVADAVAGAVEAPLDAPWRGLGFGDVPPDLPALPPLAR